MIPPRVNNKIVGITNSVEGFLAYFLTPILPKIVGEPTRESLIKTHQLISGNAASMESNLRGGQQGHLVLTMTVEDYLDQTVHVFVPPYNPGNYPLEITPRQWVPPQEQAFGTEGLRQNQALFRRCTTVEGNIKKKTVTEVQQVFLSPIMEQMKGSGQLMAIKMLQHLFRSYSKLKNCT